MNDDILQWVEKAEGDFEGAVILSKKRSTKSMHLICFACQQSAEKYLKAFLVASNVSFPKTHDLTYQLLPLCKKIDPEFKVLHSYLEILDPYAVRFRYPGVTIIRREVRPAIDAAKKIRKFVRGKLGLEKQKRLL